MRLALQVFSYVSCAEVTNFQVPGPFMLVMMRLARASHRATAKCGRGHVWTWPENNQVLKHVHDRLTGNGTSVLGISSTRPGDRTRRLRSPSQPEDH
jgi:hypothetical protein